jgi:hypothetical protein
MVHLLHHGRVMCGIPLTADLKLLRWASFFEYTIGRCTYCEKCKNAALKYGQGDEE